jgi:hypothetical protein
MKFSLLMLGIFHGDAPYDLFPVSRKNPRLRNHKFSQKPGISPRASPKLAFDELF